MGTRFSARDLCDPEHVDSHQIRDLAALCGFELAGVVAALPHSDSTRYDDWASRGLAGRMGYLTDHRGAIRRDPRRLLPSARSIICVGKLYNGPEPYSTRFNRSDLAWISRYAWGDDYHDVLRAGLERLAAKLGPNHEWRACVATAPLLERSYARQARLRPLGP